MFDSRYIGLYSSFACPLLKIITILTFCHALCSSLIDKHLVYSLPSVFEMVSSTDFNVSAFIWPVAVTFVISVSAASTSHDVISGTSFGSVRILVLCSLSYSSV